MLIITADDYGRDIVTTDNIARCGLQKRISSASAMVYMQDSERAAKFAKDTGLELGIHLNFTEVLTGDTVSDALRFHHTRIVNFLQSYNMAHLLYNPFLAQSFKMVFQSQLDEYERLYNSTPGFYNGHHHMHLCSNVLFGRLLPSRSRVRNTFTFKRGEKDAINRWYRNWLNRRIRKKFISPKSFFTIVPVTDIPRIEMLFTRSRSEDVEIEVHPGLQDELEFICGETFGKILNKVPLGTFGQLRQG